MAFDLAVVCTLMVIISLARNSLPVFLQGDVGETLREGRKEPLRNLVKRLAVLLKGRY